MDESGRARRQHRIRTSYSAGRAPNLKPNLRTDNWRKSPILTFLGLSAFVLYAAIRTTSQSAYFVEAYHYLSPFAAPCLSDACGKAAEFGTLGTFPQLFPLAILTLPFLLGFRLTCYYYRKAYYRAFWQSPVACASWRIARCKGGCHGRQPHVPT